MTDEQRSCRTCKHSAMDMDLEPFCAHPNVCALGYPFGLNFSSGRDTIDKACPYPSLPLYQKHPLR